MKVKNRTGMMLYRISIILLFALTGHKILCAPSFTSWPRVVTSYSGQSATLTWTLSEAINTNWYSIVLNYEKPPPITICTWRGFNPNNIYYASGYNADKVRADIKTASKTVSYTLYNLQSDDVRYNYKCQVRTTPQPVVSNAEAWILLYGKPTTPVISRSPSNVVENGVLTLTCSASSTSISSNSLPTHPTMEYRWQRDKSNISNDGRHRVNGNILTIDKIQRQDHNIAYRCIAQETGSKLSNYKDLALDVRYKPGSARAKPDRLGPYFEGYREDLTMSCTASDPGNPAAKFEWSKDGIVKGVSNSGSYIISAGHLSVSEHDGLWQCTPVNLAGRGQPDSINVTVYAKPVFVENLHNQTIKAEIQSNLDVLCSISGRPSVDVMWRYKAGSLPAGVTIISESDIISDKLTTVKRRLTWSKESTLSQRRSTGGEYTCVGRVFDEETKQRINLNVHYEPYDINIITSGNITMVENESLTLTCTATCNPACTYKWTKNGQQFSNTDKLHFGAIKREQQGAYKCTASNGIGLDKHKDVYIQVNYPPELHTKVTSSGDIIQGSEVTITCIVDSRPDPSSITWSNITVSDITVFNNSENNNTHCWLTLSDINILHSGSYQCRADNGVRGSPVSINKTLIVYGPPRWYELDPVDKVIGASVGDRVNFKVWVIARPLPRQDEWQWKFSPTNSSNIINTKPGQVDLTLSGDMALLSITSVTINHYGNYYIWTKNKYGGWNEEDLSFILKPQGPPLKPDHFHVTDVTAVSIRVEWITGFNGGLPQTFTIRYTNIATEVVMTKSDIEDIGAGSGQILTDDITDGIEPETEYKLEIFAVNSQGQTAGDIQSAVTPALASFQQKPQITINNDKAEIHFVISGPLTHIKVENCVKGREICVTVNVTIPEKSRRKRQTSEVIHDFITEVRLADPESKVIIFSFWIYDGDVVLYSQPIIEPVNTSKVPVTVIIGVVVSFTVIIVIIMIVLWRKGLLITEICRENKYSKRMVTNNESEGHVNSVLTCENEAKPYATSKDIGVVAVVEGPSTSTVGPLTGDIYSEVNKKRKTGNKQESSSGEIVYSKVNKPKTSPKPIMPDKPHDQKPGNTTNETPYENIAPSEQAGTVTRSQPHDKSPRNTPYVNVSQTEIKDGTYSEVQIPQLMVKNSSAVFTGTLAKRQTNDKQNKIKLIGEDGITYADLEVMYKSPDDPEMIHGKENCVDYASIDFSQLK